MGMRLNKKLPWHMIPTIMALAWPTMLEQLMQTAVQYIDTAMVGSLGTQATAAVGSTSTINWLIGSSTAALSIGFLAFVSQSIGSGDREKAVRASSQAVLTTLVVGTLFTGLTLGLSGVIPVWMQVEPQIRIWHPPISSFCICPCCSAPLPLFSERFCGQWGIPRHPCGWVSG